MTDKMRLFADWNNAGSSKPRKLGRERAGRLPRRVTAGVVCAALCVSGLAGVLGIGSPANALPADSVCAFIGTGAVTKSVDGPVSGPNPGTFVGPQAMAIASDGAMYVADGTAGSSIIRRVAGGQITTLPILPSVQYVGALVIDRSRTPNVLYGAGYGFVWRWTIGSAGTATVIAGRPGQPGVANFSGPATNSSLGLFVSGLSLTPTGNLVIGDGQSVPSGVAPGGRIYQLTDPWNPSLDTSRPLTLVAGNGSFGAGVSGLAISSPMTLVTSLTVRNNGNIVYRQGFDLFEISTASGTQILQNRSGNVQQEESIGSGVQLPTANILTLGLVADRRAGSNLVYSFGGVVSRVQSIDFGVGIVSDFAGSGELGYQDGIGTAAQFAMESNYNAATIGTDNAIYVADYWNRRIRRVDVVTQAVTTVAGAGQSAQPPLGNPRTVGVDRLTGMVSASNGDLYFATSNHRVYRYISDNEQVTLLAGNGKNRFAGQLGGTAPRTGAPTQLDIGLPRDMAFDESRGDVYVVTPSNAGIWRIPSSGGAAQIYDSNDGIVGPVNAIAVDTKNRRLYYTSAGRVRSLQITVNGLTGPDTVVAGGGSTPIGISESPALSTDIGDVSGVAVGRGGVFFSATNGVGRLDVAAGTVSRIAGVYQPAPTNGETGATVAAPDVAAVDTKTNPRFSTLTASDNGDPTIYWADSFGVMSITPNRTAGLTSEAYRTAIARRVTGKLWDQNLPELGNGGPAAKATMFGITDVAVGFDGEVFVSDSIESPGELTQQIRLVATNGCARIRFNQSYLSEGTSARASGNGVPLADIPASALPIGLNGYADLTLASAPLASTPLASTPLASTPLASTPLASTPLASTPLASTPLASTPLLRPAGGWAALLRGTRFEGVPIQNLKLLEVLQSTDPTVRGKVQSIRLSDIDLTNSPLQSLSIASIALGNTPLSSIKLPTANADAFAGWCEALASIGYSCAALGITPQSTVFELDIKSVPLASTPLASTPLASTPLASTPLASTPLASTPLASTPLASTKLVDINMEVAPLASTPLASTELRNQILDCSKISCAGTVTLLAAFRAGAIRPDATVGQIAALIGSLTLEQFAKGLPAYVTFGDALLLFVRRADFPWESIPLERLNLPAIGADLSVSLIDVTATFLVRPDRPAEPLVLSAELPAGFASRLVAGSVPTVDGSVIAHTRQVTPPASGRGEIVTFTFPAAEFSTEKKVVVPLRLKAGLVAGVGTTTWKLSPANLNAAEVVATTETLVSEANEPNDLPDGVQILPTLPSLLPDTLMTGSLPSGDFNDSFQVVAKGPKGTRNTFYLSNLDIDADLFVYDTSGVAPLRSVVLRPLQSAPLALAVGPSLRTTGTSADPQPAAELNATFPVDQIAGASLKRAAVDETVEVISDGGPGGYIVQIRPYNSANSTKPYLLRMKQTFPATSNCIPAPTGTGGVLGTAPSGAALAGKTSVVLVNRQRLGNLYGTANVEGPSGVIARLEVLAAQTNGVVVAVDSNAAVRSAYSAWDSSPCNVDGANGVVFAINSYVDQLFPAGPARAALRSITLVGGDDLIPMGRVVDDTTLSNEADYASDLAAADNQATPLSAAAVGFFTLTDDPYASFTPRAYGARILYSPDVAIGRLVETPAEILTQINTFLTPVAGRAIGEINPQTSLVTGYDFLSDGALALRDNLAPQVPSQATLVNETWTRSDLASQVFPAGDAPAIQSINAHFSHNEALPAAGNTASDTSDLFTTADVAATANADRLARRILLSVGCHAGMNVPDLYVGASSRRLDWAQAFARQGAVFVGNTGFGYGDTDLVAYSEKLHREIARNLRSGSSIADAIRYAKQAYLAEGLTTVYDPKVLMQTVYYGIPQYRIAGTFVPPQPPVVPPVGVDPKTNLQAAAITLASSPVEVGGPFYSVPGQDPLVADGRPVQPRSSVDVTQPGLVAHGAVITSLTSTDRDNFSVKFSRPMVDLAANEQPLKPSDSAYPTSLQNITAFQSPGVGGQAVDRQRLVIAMGQWFNTSTTNPGVGTQRIYSNVQAKVFYRPASDTDFTQPTVTDILSERVGNDVRFSVTASDAGGIKRVLVLYLDGGTWRSLDLIAGDGGVFTGSTPTQSANPNYFVQVVDGSGNVAVTANKAVLFNATSGGGGTPVPNPEPPITGTNAAPVLSTLTVTPVAAGGSTTVTVTGSFVDPDSTTWTGTLDFGDGAGPVALILNPDKTFTAQKTFSVPGTFSYTARVTIVDNQSASASQQAAYTFTNGPANVAPTVSSAAATTAVASGVVRITVNGAFIDADSTAWTGTVDWGDGAAPAPLTITNSNRTFTAQTTSFTAGQRTGTVRVCDSANACGVKTFTYTVTPPARQLLTPIIDCITVTKTTVTVRFGYNNPNAYPVTIPVSSRNYFFPGAANRNQPTTFAPGRQRRVFAITLANANQVATWVLDGRLVVFSKNFAKC
jgi:hypothetical protein